MKKLVKRAQGGDADAFVQLMEENRQSMYKVAVCYVNNPEDAADIMQDTMLAAFEKIQDLKEPGYFRTWLTRILINKCKDSRAPASASCEQLHLSCPAPQRFPLP